MYRFGCLNGYTMPKIMNTVQGRRLITFLVCEFETGFAKKNRFDRNEPIRWLHHQSSDRLMLIDSNYAKFNVKIIRLIEEACIYVCVIVTLMPISRMEKQQKKRIIVVTL